MLAMEEQRKAMQQKTDLELEDEERSKAVVSNAQHSREETMDAVKHMNSQVCHGIGLCASFLPRFNPKIRSAPQMLYAKCVTIRDAQLLEKQIIRKEQTDEEKAIYRFGARAPAHRSADTPIGARRRTSLAQST